MNELSPSEIENSAIFFQALHRLLEDQKGSSTDRRREARRPYQCAQLLAFYDGHNSPSQAEFRNVLCHDLSPGGFSFFADEAPNRAYVIIALGAVPFTFFIARVLRVRPAAVDEGGGYLVGCRFLRRVETAADLTNLDSAPYRPR